MIGGTGGPRGGAARSVLRRSTAALAVTLLVLVATMALLALTRDSGLAELERAAVPWQEPGNELTEQGRVVAAAARAETLAFLTVDHRDMQPLMDRVLDGATGRFREQYEARREDLAQRAEQARSISTGEVVALGIDDLDGDSATVYVAANSQVENATTDGRTQPRYYRLRLDLEQVEGRWLVSRVRFVG
jgi:hypothetical protein